MLILLGATFVLALLIGLVIGMASGRDRGVVIHDAPPRPLKLAEMDPAVLSEIQELVRNDRMIDAIKRYRAATGMGLREAKDAVESIKRGG